MNLNITVYSRSTALCVDCRATEIMLRRRKIAVTKVMVDEDADAKAYVSSLGYRQTPVVMVHDDEGNLVDHWAGFSTEKIEALAKKIA